MRADLQPEGSAIVPAKKTPRRCLLVDASSTMLYYHGILLRRFEYEVVTASSAEEALEAVGREVPAVVITEVSLPRMSGVDLIRRLREGERTRDLPIVVLTGERDARIRASCLDAGASAYIAKPVEPGLLYRTIQEATERTPRQFIRLETCLQVIVGDGSSLGGAERAEYATALSEGGLYVRTLYPQPRNALTPVRIFIGEREVRVKAEVLYVNRMEGGPFREPGMGMRFVDLSADDRAFLREFIRQELLRGIDEPGKPPGG